jgi:hypothetical protein
MQPLTKDQAIEMNDDALITDDTLLALVDELVLFENQFDLGSKFNIFEAVGMVRQEIRHSRFLANLLDPNEAHGLGDRFLRSILIAAISKHPNTTITKLQLAIADLSDTLVYCERDNFDITVELPKLRTIFVIENKVDSNERQDQLQDYRSFAVSRYPHYKFMGCFLTPDGIEGDDEHWGTLSYSDIVKQLNLLLDQRSIAPNVSACIENYIDLIERNIVTPEERIQACRIIYARHRTAIQQIVLHGAVSGFAEALRVFIEEEPQVKLVQEGTTHGVFVDHRWLMPERFQVADPKRWQPTCPIKYWFRQRPGKLILRLEVGPVRQDADFNRTAFVQSVREAVQGKDRQVTSDTFTRVRTHSAVISDDPTTEELLPAMRKLWQTMGGTDTSENVLKAAEKNL